MEHLSVTKAHECVFESVAMLGAESVKLEQSLGRVLAGDVRANRDIPPYDVSAMDGYAVRSADLVNIPATLAIIEDIKAGDTPARTVQGGRGTGKCARVRVVRHPRVAILSTGNELEDIDDPVDPDKIPDSNSYALMAQVQALGIEPALLGIARGDLGELAECL